MPTEVKGTRACQGDLVIVTLGALLSSVPAVIGLVATGFLKGLKILVLGGL